MEENGERFAVILSVADYSASTRFISLQVHMSEIECFVCLTSNIAYVHHHADNDELMTREDNIELSIMDESLIEKRI